MKVSDFQTRLKEAMNIRGLRGVDLVEKTGFSKSKISQYVNGVHLPKQNAIYILAKVLRVDEGWLMGYECPMERRTLSGKEHEMKVQEARPVIASVKLKFGAQVQKLLDSFTKLNKTGKDKLIIYMNDLLSNPKNVKKDEGKITKY